MHRQIVALGGGGFWAGDSPVLDDFLLALVPAARPKVCFVGTASGDAESYVRGFYREYGKRACVPSHFPLFAQPPGPARDHLLAQDLIYVGGGNTANMLVLWRFHGLDLVLREAWENGTILAGPSAGAICWFEDGVTASVGNELGGLGDGLALVRGSFCPHYRDDHERTKAFHRLLAGGFPAGVGARNDVAVRFVDGELREVVSAGPRVAAYGVEHRDGHVVETPLESRLLG